MKIFIKSDKYMLEQPKIIIISKFYQTYAKISKLTGATAPVEKVKEISSLVNFENRVAHRVRFVGDLYKIEFFSL